MRVSSTTFSGSAHVLKRLKLLHEEHVSFYQVGTYRQFPGNLRSYARYRLSFLSIEEAREKEVLCKIEIVISQH